VDSVQKNETITSFVSALSPPGNSGATVAGRPILNFSFAVSSLFGRENLFSHHLINLLIHCGNALILYGILSLAFGAWHERLKLRNSAGAWAFIIALLWALHPLQTESVTYIVQRAESLVSLFYLLTLYFFMRAVSLHGRGGKGFLACSVVCCALGMGSKEVMVSAPLAVLLLDRVFIAGSFLAAWRARKAYYAGLCATWAVLIISIVSSGFRGNTTGFDHGITWGAYLSTQCYALVHYLRLVIWPHPLIFDYGCSAVAAPARYIPQAIFLLAIVALGARQLVRNTPAGFLIALVCMLLAPTTFIPVVTQTIAEHRFYLALAPTVVLAAVYADGFLNRKTMLFGGVFLALAAGILTYQRNGDYRSIESLWTDTVHKRPINARAWFSLGHVYLTQHKLPESRKAFSTALTLEPRDPGNMIGYAHALAESGESDEAITLYRKALATVTPTFSGAYEAMSNLGMLLDKKGDTPEAISLLKKAIQTKPDETGAHYNLGSLYFSRNQYADAVPELRRATSDRLQGVSAKALLIRGLLYLGRNDEALSLSAQYTQLHPDSAEIGLAYGQALAATGKYQQALAQYNSLLRTRPDFTQAHLHLGILQLAARDYAGARQHLEIAIAHDPAGAIGQTTFGDLLLRTGQPAEAVPHYEIALQSAPHDQHTRYVLANTLLQLGELEKAVPHYERLVQENAPPRAEIRNELGITYAQLGRLDDARRQFEACLQIDPEHAGVRENLQHLRDSAP